MSRTIVTFLAISLVWARIKQAFANPRKPKLTQGLQQSSFKVFGYRRRNYLRWRMLVLSEKSKSLVLWHRRCRFRPLKLSKKAAIPILIARSKSKKPTFDPSIRRESSVETSKKMPRTNFAFAVPTNHPKMKTTENRRSSQNQLSWKMHTSNKNPNT